MKVTKLHIDDYRVFKDFDIDFTDGEGNAQNLIVLAGINGAGKTTLLEFIFSVISRKSTGYDDNQLQGSFVELNINREDKFYLTRNTLPLSQDSIRIFCDKRILREKIGDNEAYGDVHLFQIDDLASNNDDQRGRFQFSEIHIISDYIDRQIYENGIPPFDAYQKLGDYFSSILSDFELGFRFTGIDSYKRPRFTNIQGKEVYLENLSTGERRLVSLVTNLYIADLRNCIILIDEPEFSFHPSWQNMIVGILKKYSDQYNCQIILATHSPQIIGSVKPEQLRLLTKDENGVIKVVEYTPNSYGLTFDRVLTEVMGVTEQRTPEIEKKLSHLSDLIKSEEFDSFEFGAQMKEVEDLIGYSDSDLVLMRFEIAKRRKQRAADSQK